MTTQYTMVMRCEVLWRDFFGRLFAEHTLVVKSAGQPDPFGLLIVLKELRTVSNGVRSQVCGGSRAKKVVHFDVVRHPLLVFSREILFSSLSVGLDYRDLLSHLCNHSSIN